MLHFAQVQKEATTSETQLRLLARQESDENTWALIEEAEVISPAAIDGLSNGLLVLVELSYKEDSPTPQVLSIKDATDWVLNLVRTYLASGITVEFLQQERVRVEEGLQTLTLEKLEISRRLLEVEARREEIQELEAKLQQQMEEIQQQKEDIQKLEDKLQQQMKDLDKGEEDEGKEG
ncbi:hypothetical protein ACE1B6_07375 [Aerosakkonemataceae cyanobacterium BLCC-F154]|uniref:Uncharacterized protein n=1 Tax=Floridaenema fluviatile BLCC-F154 TaxID=3153640 RepID=A0ABV4YA17_9CYAN